MPNHLRQQIRERAGTTLTGLATTGSSVFQSRFLPISEANLPALRIYTKSETCEISTLTSTKPKVDRYLTMIIEGLAQETANLDDKLDTIAKEVETALSNDFTLNNLCERCELQSTEIDFSDGATKPIGVVTLNYLVHYRTVENDPTAAA